MKNAAISEKVFHDAAEYINMHPGNFFKSDAEELKKFNSTEFKESLCPNFRVPWPILAIQFLQSTRRQTLLGVYGIFS